MGTAATHLPRRRTCSPHRSRAKNDTRAASPHLEPGAHGPEGCAGPGPRRRAGGPPAKIPPKAASNPRPHHAQRCQPQEHARTGPHRPAAGHGGGRFAAADGPGQKDLLIVSPYFVPGPDMNGRRLLQRGPGVRVRVLTNSLASNDAPIAHAGYARHRRNCWPRAWNCTRCAVNSQACAACSRARAAAASPGPAATPRPCCIPSY